MARPPTTSSATTSNHSSAGMKNAPLSLGAMRRTAVNISGGRQGRDPVSLHRGVPPFNLSRRKHLCLNGFAERAVSRLAQNGLPSPGKLLQPLAEIYAVPDQRVLKPLLRTQQG